MVGATAVRASSPDVHGVPMLRSGVKRTFRTVNGYRTPHLFQSGIMPHFSATTPVRTEPTGTAGTLLPTTQPTATPSTDTAAHEANETCQAYRGTIRRHRDAAVEVNMVLLEHGLHNAAGRHVRSRSRAANGAVEGATGNRILRGLDDGGQTLHRRLGAPSVGEGAPAVSIRSGNYSYPMGRLCSGL